jgi:hypothetical protein
MDKHVVFVHGLRRAGVKVWMSSGKRPEVWPRWLATDIERLGVWSVEHDSAPTLWGGFSMPLVDRANNILALLLSEKRLKQGDISFVVHSFGGLIFEQLLRTASDRSATEQNVADLVKRIRRVTFLGTPHLGADLATWAGRLRLLARPSSATQGLARNDPNLRALNQWYRHFAPQNRIATQTLFETRSTRFGWVVKPDSADPGLPSDPIPIDADHFSIASPASKNSEIYRHVRDFLNTPAAPSQRRTLVADAVLESIANDTSQNSATLERIEQRLSTSTASEGLRQEIPGYLVDAETEKRISLLRRKRFFFGSDHLEQASRLARDLLQGELAATSTVVKASVLAWCARMLFAHPDRTEALRVLDAARNLARTEEVSIVEALADSYEGDTTSALSKLGTLKTPSARAVSFVVVGNSRGPAESLDWLRQAGLTLSDVDSDGKFFVIRNQLGAGRWAEALESANALQPSDFERTPALLYAAGGAHLAQAVPEELITLILWHLPFDAAPIPLADDAASIAERRNARNLYARASEAAASVGCIRASQEASDRALWLGLRDPVGRTEARAELEQSMRDPAHSLRRLPLAVQFGLNLDLQAVEKEIDRQETLSGGSSPDAALARFSIALTKKSPREVAEYIDRHREQLFRHLNPSFVTSVEVQMLAKSGQIELAETRIQQLSDTNQSGHERERLTRIIAEARGANPTEARERLFQTSDTLTDLANLVELLESQKDWQRLVTYGRTFFERTHDVSGCRVFAQALFETSDFKGVVDLLSNQPDLVGHSDYLESLLVWSLYRTGDVKECRRILAKLRAKRDDANDRILTVSLAIASGDWTSLVAFVEQEWDKRNERDAEDLLRAGQLAHHLGTARAKELIFEAAAKADGDPTILIGCYSTAVNAGWESEITSTWLERAAALSGEDGPVKRVSLKELFDLQPDWQQREKQTWEQLHAGMMPIFTAGHLLNRSLIDLFLLPALSNVETIDPRRRGLVYAFSGARPFVQGTLRTAALDPTALLTAGILGAIDSVFGMFESIVIPHTTLGWLFEEKERIQFHQPSKVADALEIKRLLDAKALQQFESAVAPDNALATEIGDELAALFVEAEADRGEDRRQHLVVRSSPVHRIGSLMEEEADLGDHANHVCGCLDLVNALARQGQLTQAEEQRARAYLTLQEKPWPNPKAIEAGAVLYLDELSVTYLQHLHLLQRIQAAGFTGIIPSSEVSQGDNLIRHESLADRATSVIEDIRRALSEGIESGKVVLAAASKSDDKQFQRIQHHPTWEIIEAAALADAVVIDDRYFNQLGNVEGPFGTKPIWTTFDLITATGYDPSQQREYLTAMRRAGLGFIPITVEELMALLGQTSVSGGRLVESAELKAIRESLLVARMSNGLQLPKEGMWLDNIVRTFTEAIKSQWHADMEDQVARARSDWLLEQFDIRQWSHRYKVDGHPEVAEIRFRGQILSLALLNTPVPRAVKARYWQWFDDALLKRIQEEQRELYDALVQQVRATIIDASERGQNGDGDAG